ncbi:MAG: TauD/TfdA family dioxygenase [Actinobacteria bacterium]|nr:TauD/TfdA family dioxygenase [Actinomycetota bacterium]
MSSDTVRSYLEQTLHYFDRPHTGQPTADLVGPWAWRGADLAADPHAWCRPFTDVELAELGAASQRVVDSGAPLETLTKDDVPLGPAEASVAAWRTELADGRGFLLLRGAPVEAWGPQRSEAAFWVLGLHLGAPGCQDVDGRLLGHVTDEGGADAGTRSYRTNRNIRYHCDAADVVGLLCLATASAGGLSRLASSVTVFNVLRAEAPDLAARFFEPFELDTRSDDVGSTTVPIEPCRFDGVRLRTFFHADYFGSADRHPGVTLTDLDRAALAAYEETAERPEIRLDMELAVGDVQLVSNHSTIHARTAYDDDGTDGRRHLLRLWLSLDRG